MKTLLPLTAAILAAMLFLSGCPDTKVPKVPPKAPEPKAVTHSTPAAPHALPAALHVPHLKARTQA